MRFLLSLVAAVAAYEVSDDEWSKFKADFNKVYATEDLEATARSTYAKNVEIINRRNAAQSQYVLAVNEFADIPTHEFAKSRFGLSQGPMPKLGAPLRVHKADPAVELPASVDWVEKGAVTDVKNQGQCGSCWSFSTTGALEGANFIATGNLVAISEQQFIDCDSVDQGCNGGLMDNAFEFAENHELCSEDSYSYKAAPGSCTQECDVVLEKGAVTGHVDVDADETALRSAVAKQPVSVAIEADQEAFQFYKSGVLTAPCGTNLDHGVLVVGYGQEDGTDYWKVKNSWGPSWGLEGYIKLQRGLGGGGECGILMKASYPEVQATGVKGAEVDACEICKLATGAVEQLGNKVTKDEMEAACSHLGRFSDKCKSFVDAYGDKIVDAVHAATTAITPDTICKMLNECTSEEVELVV